MTKKKMNDYSVFAMHFLKLAQNRKLMNRFNRDELFGRIKALPNYRTLILDPALCEDLVKEYTRWKGSKNLFVLFALLQQLHVEALSQGASGMASEDEETDENLEEEEDEESEDEDEEGGTAKEMMAGLKKYEELLAERVNMKAFKEWVLRVRFVGRAGNWAQEKMLAAQVHIYHFRNTLKDYKDRLDNGAYEIFGRTLDSLPDGARKTMLLIIGWLIVKILGILLLLLLIFTRPTIILEKLGIDGEMLPLPVE